MTLHTTENPTGSPLSITFMEPLDIPVCPVRRKLTIQDSCECYTDCDADTSLFTLTIERSVSSTIILGLDPDDCILTHHTISTSPYAEDFPLYQAYVFLGEYEGDADSIISCINYRLECEQYPWRFHPTKFPFVFMFIPCDEPALFRHPVLADRFRTILLHAIKTNLTKVDGLNSTTIDYLTEGIVHSIFA